MPDVSLIAWVFVAWWLLSFPVGLWVGKRLARRSRAHRYGGYIVLSASEAMREDGEPTQGMVITVHTSSPSEHGDQQEEGVTPTKLRLLSKPAEHSSPGNETGDAGDATTNGPAAREHAAFGDLYCECGAHVKGTPCFAGSVDGTADGYSRIVPPPASVPPTAS